MPEQCAMLSIATGQHCSSAAAGQGYSYSRFEEQTDQWITEDAQTRPFHLRQHRHSMGAWPRLASWTGQGSGAAWPEDDVSSWNASGFPSLLTSARACMPWLPFTRFSSVAFAFVSTTAQLCFVLHEIRCFCLLSCNFGLLRSALA